MTSKILNQDVTNDDILKMLAGELLPSDIHKRRAAKQRARELGKRQREIEVELDKFSTRKLLAMRDQTYMGDRVWLDEDTGLYYMDNGSWSSKQITAEEYGDHVARRFALYAVLKRRPHIPNKIEAKTARHNAATAHHGPKKRGGRTFRVEGGATIRRGGRAR